MHRCDQPSKSGWHVNFPMSGSPLGMRFVGFGSVSSSLDDEYAETIDTGAGALARSLRTLS